MNELVLHSGTMLVDARLGYIEQRLQTLQRNQLEDRKEIIKLEREHLGEQLASANRMLTQKVSPQRSRRTKLPRRFPFCPYSSSKNSH
jgi:hypothetical protein